MYAIEEENLRYSPLIKRPLTLLNCCCLGSLSPRQCKANKRRQITAAVHKKTIVKESNLDFLRSGNKSRAGLEHKSCKSDMEKKTDSQTVADKFGNGTATALPPIPSSAKSWPIVLWVCCMSTWRGRKARAQFNTLQAGSSSDNELAPESKLNLQPYSLQKKITAKPGDNIRATYSKMHGYRITMVCRSGLIITSWRAGH